MYRNQRILDLPRRGDIACQFCGKEDGTIVMAHSNQGRHGKGMGIRAHDCFVAALCFGCHSFVDQGKASEEVRLTVWQAAHRKTLRLIGHLLGPEGLDLLLAASKGEHS